MSLISVNDLGKAYFTYKSEWHRFARWLGIPIKPKLENWVLRNINFEIQKGQAIGIIGQNGAGKSTLLKLLTGVLQPSEGQMQVNGRISAILELGMGFNPDFTGRQNVYHSAGLMGFSYDQINSVIEQIEEFAEIGEYFDKPVRMYSSGMQVRVAFSVATAWRPEVLIVDEALSVGDAYFQHKSFAKIREFQEQGTTLLIVSHDRSAIQVLCNRAILLENGSVIRDGEPEEIFDFYNALIAEKEANSIEVERLESGVVKTVSGTKEATFRKMELLNAKGDSTDFLKVGEEATVRFIVDVNKPIKTLVIGCGIKDRLGQMIFGTNTFNLGKMITDVEVGDCFTVDVSFAANLGVGSYSIHASLVEERDHIHKNFQWVDNGLIFNVVNFDKPEFVGVSWNEMHFNIQKNES